MAVLLRDAGLSRRHAGSAIGDDCVAGFVGMRAGAFVAEITERHGSFEDRGIRAIRIGSAFGGLGDAEPGSDSLDHGRRTFVPAWARRDATGLVE